jgi:formimidoylglutamase
VVYDLSTPDEWHTYLKGQFEGPGPSPWGERNLFGETIETATLESAEEYDAVLVGEPYDRGDILARPGARFGPGEVRHSLANTKTRNLSSGSITLDVADLGNVIVPRGTSNRALVENIREFVTNLHELDVFPIFVGGDHTLTYPNCAPLFDIHDSVGVINIDSHDDLQGNIDGEPHSGSNFNQLYEEGLDGYTMLGANHFGLTDDSYAFLHERGGAIITDEDVGDDPDAAAAEALATMDSVDAVYVTLDIDALEIPFAPGTSAPYPGGILPRELFRMLRQLLADDRVVAFDVVEVADTLDHERSRTSGYGGVAIAHALGGLQSRHRSE